MADITAQVWQMLADAESLPLSSSKLALLQEAVNLADAHQRIDLGLEARKQLMFAARNLLRGDILTVAFTWCLAQYDRDPQLLGGQNLFWEYQMVIGQLANLADVARATLDEMLNDLGRRLRAAGYSLGSVHVTCCSIAADVGDRPLALAAQESIRQLRAQGQRDFHYDRFDEIETELFLGNEERALQLAQAVLRQPGSSRRIGMDTACAGLLLPLLKRRRIAEGERLAQHCLRLYHPERCYYWSYGDLLKWLTLANQIPRAVRVYEECQRAIKSFTDPLTRLHFALDAVVLFDRLAQEGRQNLPLRLPDWVPVASNSGTHSVESLRAWHLREAGELADRFDNRNGTTYFREQIQERRELQRWALAEPSRSDGE